MFDILIIGGDWNLNNGRSSSFVDKFSNSLNKISPYPIKCLNGGNYNDLSTILGSITSSSCVIWMANVPNDLKKIRNVKDFSPKTILINSKRNDNNEYSFQELVARSLEQKANLTLEFKKDNGIIKTRIFDPLGTVWCDFTDDLDLLSVKLLSRLSFLLSIKRENINLTGEKFNSPDIPDELLEKFKFFGQTFHDLIQPEEGTKRFLGNMSFRCLKGFPSFRQGDVIFVSRRNVDKKYISKEDFIPVKLTEDGLFASGDIKPSVDTPVQVRLYKNLPDVNYMLHAHVYVKNAPFTSVAVPCGGLQEVDEIMDLINILKLDTDFAINLIGHGCLICAKDYSYFDTITFINRPVPEIL